MPIGNAFDTSTLGLAANLSPEMVYQNTFRQTKLEYVPSGFAGFSATGPHFVSSTAGAGYSSIIISATASEEIIIYEVLGNSYAATTDPFLVTLAEYDGTNVASSDFLIVQASLNSPFRMSIPNGLALPQGKSVALLRVKSQSSGGSSNNFVQVVYSKV